MAEAGVPRPVIATCVRSLFAHLDHRGLINQMNIVIVLTDSISCEDRYRDNKALSKTKRVKDIKERIISRFRVPANAGLPPY